MNKMATLVGSILLLATSWARAETLNPAAILQFGPTSEFSTLVCQNFVRGPDGSWRTVRSDSFSLGFVQDLIPPARPIKLGGYIFNNIDLYSQLEYQCAASAAVSARY